MVKTKKLREWQLDKYIFQLCNLNENYDYFLINRLINLMLKKLLKINEWKISEKINLYSCPNLFISGKNLAQ